MRTTTVITFSPAELEFLRLEAERVQKLWKEAGVFPRRVYEYERYEFAREYMRGALGTLSEKQTRWAERIKKELKHVRRGTKDASAETAGGTTSHGAGSKNR